MCSKRSKLPTYGQLCNIQYMFDVAVFFIDWVHAERCNCIHLLLSHPGAYNVVFPFSLLHERASMRIVLRNPPIFKRIHLWFLENDFEAETNQNKVRDMRCTRTQEHSIMCHSALVCVDFCNNSENNLCVICQSDKFCARRVGFVSRSYRSKWECVCVCERVHSFVRFA